MSYEIAIAVSVPMIAFTLAYISTKFDKNLMGATAYQILFLGTSVLILVLDVGYLIDIADTGGATNLADQISGGLWFVMGFFLLFFYCMIIFSFVYSLMKSVNTKKRRKEEKMYLLDGD